MERKRLYSRHGMASRMGGMHRRYRRESVSGFSADIADGHRLIGGVVDDISSTGYKMSQVDEAFQADGHHYQTVVSGNGRHYKILAKPCWKKKTDRGLEIGFKIMDVSWEWAEFVLETLAPQGDRAENPQKTS